MTRTWLVTGSSSGLGRALVEVVAGRGDRVLATARRPEAVADLVERYGDLVVPHPLDVRDGGAAAAAVRRCEDELGGLDVLAPWAGHGLLGAVEELPEPDLRESYEVHLFAPLALARAALPGMRARGQGVIVLMSSLVGVIPGPGGSAYVGPKAALDAVGECLAAEVAGFGVRVLVVEPGAFRTDFSGRSLQVAEPMPAYAPMLGPATEAFRAGHGSQPGDPRRAAEAVVAAVDDPEAPLRLPLGPDAFTYLDGYFRARLTALTEAHPRGSTTSY